jgi:hypothetical protein
MTRRPKRHGMKARPVWDLDRREPNEWDEPLPFPDACQASPQNETQGPAESSTEAPKEESEEG